MTSLELYLTKKSVKQGNGFKGEPESVRQGYRNRVQMNQPSKEQINCI